MNINQRRKLEMMQQYVANIAIGPSTLRNQGAKGVAKTARKFLSVLDLSELKNIKPYKYPSILEKWTSGLRVAFPKGAKKWGTARKAINVFMIQVFLNKYLSNEYCLDKFGDILETPLDSQAASGLRKLAGKGRLPRWNGIKRLKPEDSSLYQEFAAKLSKDEEIPRACLDIKLWRAGE